MSVEEACQAAEAIKAHRFGWMDYFFMIFHSTLGLTKLIFTELCTIKKFVSSHIDNLSLFTTGPS